MNVKRGEIYWMTFTGTGSEQSGRRPAVVVSGDFGNARSRVVIVVALSTAPVKPFPFIVRLNGEAGLSIESYANCKQIFTVDKTRLEKLQGTLSGMTMDEIGDAIRGELEL